MRRSADGPEAPPQGAMHRDREVGARTHAAKLLDLSTDLPIVIEIVDAEEKISAFLPVADELVTQGQVTLEEVRILNPHTS